MFSQRKYKPGNVCKYQTGRAKTIEKPGREHFYAREEMINMAAAAAAWIWSFVSSEGQLIVQFHCYLESYSGKFITNARGHWQEFQFNLG